MIEPEINKKARDSRDKVRFLVACDIDQAINLLNANKVDILVSDQNLEDGVLGMDFLQAVRGVGKYTFPTLEKTSEKIKTILLTADEKIDRNRIHKGIDRVIAKGSKDIEDCAVFYRDVFNDILGRKAMGYGRT